MDPNRALQAFQQLRMGQQQASGGSGLGLSISRTIVELCLPLARRKLLYMSCHTHCNILPRVAIELDIDIDNACAGGRIEVRSAVGQGSEFIVTIPVALCPSELLPSPSVVSLTRTRTRTEPVPVGTGADPELELEAVPQPRASKVLWQAEARRARAPGRYRSHLLHGHARGESGRPLAFPRVRGMLVRLWSTPDSITELTRVDIDTTLTRHLAQSPPMLSTAASTGECALDHPCAHARTTRHDQACGACADAIRGDNLPWRSSGTDADSNSAADAKGVDADVLSRAPGPGLVAAESASKKPANRPPLGLQVQPVAGTGPGEPVHLAGSEVENGPLAVSGTASGIWTEKPAHAVGGPDMRGPLVMIGAFTARAARRFAIEMLTRHLHRCFPSACICQWTTTSPTAQCW
jgi:hypothetical protein